MNTSHPFPVAIVKRSSYGQPIIHRVDPAQYQVPRAAHELGQAWLLVAAEVDSLGPALAASIHSFCTHLGNQLHDLARLEDFSLANVRLRHLNSWEQALAQDQRESLSNFPYAVVTNFFALLRRIDSDHSGLLHPEVVVRLEQGTLLTHIRGEGLPDHPDREVRRIRSAAHRLVHSALLEQVADPDYLATPDVLVALHVLLSLATGEPPEVVRSLGIGDVIATADTSLQNAMALPNDPTALFRLAASNMADTYAVTFTKRRARARYQNIYDRRRDHAAHRALTATILLTQHARALIGSDRLWVVNYHEQLAEMRWGREFAQLSAWYETYVRGDVISKPHNFTRLRKVTIRRELIKDSTRYLRDGRRHSSRTLFAHYVNSEVLRAEAGRLLTHAINEHFEAAVGPTVITPEAEELLRQGASAEHLDAATAESLIEGSLEGALAACRDPEDSPHAVTGVTCPVSLNGNCFSCPNAIITTEHLPALVFIDELSNPSRSGNIKLWKQVWEPIHRSTQAILPLFPKEDVEAARLRTDEVPVDIGLRNELRGIDG